MGIRCLDWDTVVDSLQLGNMKVLFNDFNRTKEKKERTVGERLCFKDSLRSAKRFPNQTAAFYSCLCYVQLNL